MKLRDFLFILGSCALAAGPACKAHGPSATIWFIGDLLTVLGPVLMASRGMMNGHPPEAKP